MDGSHSQLFCSGATHPVLCVEAVVIPGHPLMHVVGVQLHVNDKECMIGIL